MDRRSPQPGTIYTGDCLDLMPSWPDGAFDACIADPPFNISKKQGLRWAFSSHVTIQESWDRFGEDDFFAFNARWLREITRLVRPGGNILVFGTYHNIYQLGFIIQTLGLRINNSIVWYKPNAQPNITCRMFTESSEQIIWAVNGGAQGASGWTFNYDEMKSLNGGRQMRNVWEIPVTPRSERIHGKHPSQKPEALLDRLIRATTRPGDRILDPFAGAGTTGVVAGRLGRNWVMIERNPEYIRIAKERLASTVGLEQAEKGVDHNG